jgi:hypothetical protein
MSKKSGPKTTIPYDVVALPLHRRIVHLCHRGGKRVMIGANHLKKIPDMAIMLGKKVFIFCTEKCGTIRGYVSHFLEIVNGQKTKHVFILEGTEITA